MSAAGCGSRTFSPACLTVAHHVPVSLALDMYNFDTHLKGNEQKPTSFHCLLGNASCTAEPPHHIPTEEDALACIPETHSTVPADLMKARREHSKVAPRNNQVLCRRENTLGFGRRQWHLVVDDVVEDAVEIEHTWLLCLQCLGHASIATKGRNVCAVRVFSEEDVPLPCVRLPKDPKNTLEERDVHSLVQNLNRKSV